MLDVPAELLRYLSRLLAAERRRRGTPAKNRKLSCRDQAVLALLGGQPLGEQIVMWWNFIGRSHDEIAGFRAQWQAQRAQPRQGSGRYGIFPSQWHTTLPAPELPNARVRLRD